MWSKRGQVQGGLKTTSCPGSQLSLIQMFLWRKRREIFCSVTCDYNGTISGLLSSFVPLCSCFLPQVWEGNALQLRHNDLVLHSMRERSENLLTAVAWQYPFSPYKICQDITHPYDFTPAFSQSLICVTTIFNRHFVW